ncbi:MAG: hypothetical protein LBS53_07745 [Synergistaceae bacterium]|jgi:multimeric flavodoxin WrbA|nr:hypothetical protein [Synergistaceae bacterium]
MKKVTAINGGPRKNWNTAAMIRSALDGAESVGAKAETFHLRDTVFPEDCERAYRMDVRLAETGGQPAI